MTILIHYTGSRNLSVLLSLIQPQLSSKDDIYLVDTTPDRSGVKIAALYGSTRCYIFVEVGKYTYEQAIGFGAQSAVENKQDGMLVINENAFISQTFIANLKKAVQLGSIFTMISPAVIRLPYLKMDPNFKLFNPPTTRVEIDYAPSIFCCYLNSDTIHNKPNIIPKIGLFTNETVLILPYTSSEKIV